MSESNTRTVALRPSIQQRRAPFFTKWILGLGLGYAIADSATLLVRSYMIPDQTPAVKIKSIFADSSRSKSEYNLIISRNIFTEDGQIPPALAGTRREKDEIPVPSQLPINLIGTIVHSTTTRSIAHLEIKGKNLTLALSPNRDIDRLATLLKVERNRIVIRNSNNGRLEFIENKTSSRLSFSTGRTAQRLDGPANIKMVGENKFEIPRSEVLKFTSDMSSIVMQASTVPHRKPTGEIDGFTITSIQPGSLFSQLGFLPGDTIKKANGEPIDSPAKAIELYNAMRNSSNVKITVSRDNDREMDFEYNITK